MHFSFKALQTIADTLKRSMSFVDACTRCAWFVTAVGMRWPGKLAETLIKSDTL